MLSDPLHPDWEYFKIIFEKKSLSLASEKLGVQQPGLSKALARLEAKLETPLFLRRKSALVPTERGVFFYQQIAKLKATWDLAIEADPSRDETVRGKMRIGAHVAIAQHLLPRVLPKLLQDFPELEPEIVFARSPEANRMVLNEQLDFALVVDPQPFDNLVQRPVGDDSVWAWGKRGMALAGKVLPRVYFNPEMLDLSQAFKRFKRHSLVAVSDYELIARLASQENAMAILPRLVATHHPQLEEIGPRLFSSKLHLVYRKDSAHPKSHRTLALRIFEILQE